MHIVPQSESLNQRKQIKIFHLVNRSKVLKCVRIALLWLYVQALAEDGYEVSSGRAVDDITSLVSCPCIYRWSRASPHQLLHRSTTTWSPFELKWKVLVTSSEMQADILHRMFVKYSDHKLLHVWGCCVTMETLHPYKAASLTAVLK